MIQIDNRFVYEYRTQISLALSHSVGIGYPYLFLSFILYVLVFFLIRSSSAFPGHSSRFLCYSFFTNMFDYLVTTVLDSINNLVTPI